MLQAKRWGLAVLVSLLSLELLLQLGALWVSYSYSDQTDAGEPGSADSSILCIGDSYTFGLGTSAPDFSYPSQLANNLREAGIDKKVINAGFPGQHSGDVVRRIRSYLHPEVSTVCVLVGINDTWRHPYRTAFPDGDVTNPVSGSFRLEWRSRKLLTMVTDFDWFSWVEERGSESRPESPQPTILDPRGAELDAAYAILGEEGIAIGTQEPVWAVDSAAPEPGWMGRIWDAMNAGNTLESVRIAEETAAAHPESPRVLQTLTEIYMRAGKRNEALATVEQIADIADQEGNGAAGDILCMALQATGADMQATYEAAKRRLSQEPNSYAAALVMQHSCFRLEKYDEALPAIMHTLNLLGRTSPQQSNLVLRNLVRISSKADPERAARLFLASFLLEPKLESARTILNLIREDCPQDVIRSVFSAQELPETESVASMRTMLQDEGHEEEWMEILREHLLLIASEVQSSGRKLVILSYPFHDPRIESVQSGVAREVGATFVPVRERFTRELATTAHRDLFVGTGHCNDSGYTIVADEVAKSIIPLLRD